MTRVPLRRTAALAILTVSLASASARAATVDELEDAVIRAMSAAAETAVHVVRDDLAAARSTLTAAQAAADEAQALADDPDVQADLGRRGTRATRKKVLDLVGRLVTSQVVLETDGVTQQAIVDTLQKATKAASKALAKPRKKSLLGPDVRPAQVPFLKPGKAWKLKIRGEQDATGSVCQENPTIVISDLAAAPSLDVAPEDRGKGKFRIRLLDGPGGGRVDITTCGNTRTWHLVNLGPKGGLDVPLSPIEPPAGLTYDAPVVSYRVDEPIADNTASLGSGGAPTSFSIAPPAPAGLTFDTVTGTLSGTPGAEGLTTAFTVTAANDAGSTQAVLSIQITPALPPDVEFLEAGFVIERLHTGLDIPVKLALLPDGRILFNELLNGRTRVIAADGTLLPTPFATTALNTGGEQGLLGLAVSPTFASDGHVFVFATVPAAGQQPIRNQVIRYTATGDVGGSPTVILDDIPASTIHNAGDLQFGPDQKLYVSTGDAEDEDNAQTDGVTAGRILRINADGTVPADNPIPGDPEWCRGLRNTFDMAFHPVTGGLFGSENGPTFGDEINFLARDKNFGWGPVPADLPAFKLGVRITDWTPVIVPTGVLFLAGSGFPADFEDDLLVLEYDEAGIRRLQLSGATKIDLDAEIPFVDLDDSGSVDNKPLDAVEAPDGTLWFSTFGGIWRVAPYEAP